MRRHGRRAVFVAVALASLLAAGEPPARGAGRPVSLRPSGADELRELVRTALPEAGRTRRIEGHDAIGVNDLARLLDATKFWRPSLRKLELRAGGHRVQLTADNPFVLLDDTTLRLPVPVRSIGGELHVPIALLEHLPSDTTLARLVFHRDRNLVFRVPAAGIVGSLRLAVRAAETRIVIPVERPNQVRIASRARAHFLLRLDGLFVGTLPAANGLVRAMRRRPAAAGLAFEIEIGAGAAGYQLIREPARGRVVLVLAAQRRRGFAAFAPEGPPGERLLEVVVLDPGHGGTDAGVTVEGAIEKDLTLELALHLQAELEERIGTRVVLTRQEDLTLTAEARAERANLEQADLVLSLHFDGFAGAAARGVTAYCPPALFEDAVSRPRGALGTGLDLVRWRDVATRHAVLSRALAEDVLSAIELRAQGPTRLREVLPYPLLGVNAPGLLLECGTLTSEADRSRLLGRNGLAGLAATIVDGVMAYQRNR